MTAFMIGLTTLINSPNQASADETDTFQGIPYYILSKDEAVQYKTDPIKIKMSSGDYSFDEWAYCIEASKDLPPADQKYPYNIYQYYSTELTEIAKSFDNPHEGLKHPAYLGVAVALLRGFPNDFSNIKARYNLTDYEFYKVTQDAVHFWTDSAAQMHSDVYNSETATNPSAQNPAFKELIQEDISEAELNAIAASRFIQAIPHDNKGANWQRIMWLEPGFDVNISKVDASTNQMLSGASLRLLNGGTTDAPLYTNGQFITTSNPRHFVLLEGTYTLVEERAPDGYDTADPIIFRVSRDGTTGSFKPRLEIVNGNTTTPITGNTITMKGKPTVAALEVIFRKIAANQQDRLLAGATLNVYGNIYNDTSASWVTVDETWTTGTEADKLELAPGDYTLTETKAPSGYDIADPIKFRITDDFRLEIQDPETREYVDEESGTVTMVDEPILPVSITFKKVNDQGGSLAGARFHVTGTKLTGEPLDDHFNVDGSGVFTWNGFYPGSYTISEETAPHDYARLTWSQAFTVSKDGKISFGASVAPEFSTDTAGRTMIIKNERVIPKMSKVRIWKEVAGQLGDKNQDFTFHLKINNDTTLPVGTPPELDNI